MTLTRTDRQQLLTKISILVGQKFYDPTFDGKNWPKIVSDHTDAILHAESTDDFESAISSMLQELGSSGLGLLGPTTKIASGSSINATFRPVETITEGPRWVFQDVLPGGVADSAGVRSGDSLISVNAVSLHPPQTPMFAMGDRVPIVISQSGKRREVQLELATQQPKYKDNPYSAPTSIVGFVARPSLGTVKVSLFPGLIGIDFAREVDAIFQEKIKAIDRLVLDLRGNPGGGIGGVRLMSYLTPSKLPIGYSIDRRAAEHGYDRTKLPKLKHLPKSKLELPLLAIKFMSKKSVVLETEGLGKQKFHGRIAILVNEHTTGAAEMLTQFAQENRLATVVGAKTPGRLVSRSAFKIGSEYRIVIPIAAYLSWQGNRVEGRGVTPDVPVDWSYRDALNGMDNQLNTAVEVAQQL